MLPETRVCKQEDASFGILRIEGACGQGTGAGGATQGCRDVRWSPRSSETEDKLFAPGGILGQGKKEVGSSDPVAGEAETPQAYS